VGSSDYWGLLICFLSCLFCTRLAQSANRVAVDRRS